MALEINRIETEWKANLHSSAYLADFIPLRLSTIIEVFVREVVRELVDFGQPYYGKAQKFTKDVKFDFLFQEHGSKQAFSIGDFVAHAVSASSVENILSTLTELLPDFLGKMKKSHPRWTEEKADWPLKAIITDWDLTIQNLKRMLEVRHIIAHELPEGEFYNKDEISDFISATRDFIEACDWVVVDCLQGSTPKTQIRMNYSAGEELEQREGELSAIISEAKKLNGIDHKKFLRANKKWQKFADSEAKLIADQVKGGSMYPMIFMSEKARLIEERIDQIEGMIVAWMD